MSTAILHTPRGIVIAGPNGAGKTTIAREFLPRGARDLTAVLALAASVTLAASDQTTAAPPPPTFAVLIDVIPLDARGRVVDDLTPADFVLREDGAAQPLDSVRFVRAGDGPSSTWPDPGRPIDDAQQAASVDGARVFAIFLDEYHVSPGASTERVREALMRFVDREMRARDLLVVMKPLDSILTIRLTPDREEGRRAIASFDGRRGDYTPRNEYERHYIAGTPARIDEARTQVVLSAVNALAVHLGTLGARRKTLVVVSEGVGGLERRRGLESLPTIETVIRSANRSNVSVYPVDPGTDRPAGTGGDALRRLATETDGEAIVEDLEGGLRRASADSRAYYLLSYRSTRPADGAFRVVQVRVTRPGITLRARPGYVAPSPDEVRRAEAGRASDPGAPVVPVAVGPAPHVSPLIRPWFGIARGANGKTQVTFVWEPAASVPGERVRRTVSRLVLSALAPDGTVLFEGPVLPTGPATVDEAGATPARAVFETPPGRLRLRMSIQDAASQVLDQDVRDLAVRDLRSGVVISTAEILRARNAREFRLLDTEGAVPAASREFSRTERLLVRFQANGPDGEHASVSATLLGRGGQAIRPLPLASVPTRPGGHVIDLPLAGLAPGEYTIELAAGTGSGEAKEHVTFRVTS
jgi:VWFA-related protein